MKPTASPFLAALAPVAMGVFAAPVCAADRYWDTGTVDIAANGDGASGNASGAAALGTWNTTTKNWDQGAGLAHVAWDNGAIDTAIFGGTQANTIRVITLGSSITVNQIRIITGSTGNFRYDIGVATDTTNAITFGGTTYSDALPQIDASGAGNNNFPAKVTGDYTASGGVFIKHGSNITTPSSSGRFAFTNTSSTFVGDVVMLSGNLSVGTQMGNLANKLVLKGGALFVSGGAGTSTFARGIRVDAASGFATNSTGVGQIMDLTGAITGSGGITRYSNALSGSNSSDVRLSGDLSGYTGILENTGNNGNAVMTIQTTATSGGAWKLSGGTLKLNTTNDTHIANGVGKSDLLMNGGTLDMNSKSETINGLSGATGTVRNNLAASTATLTVGDGDATATFDGPIINGSGTVALTKIGGGVQTLGGSSTYTGDTLVDAGTLLINGSLGATAVTVDSDARIGGDGTLGGTLHFNVGADFQFSTTQTLTVNGASVTFGGFSITDLVGLDSSVDNGTYTLIDGTAAVSSTNLLNLGFANAHDLGNGKSAYFETGSLKVIVIPEPAALLLGGLGLLGLLRRSRA
jgi:autotransporter-associated beta strand protein